jgi:hypothetical protein
MNITKGLQFLGILPSLDMTEKKSSLSNSKQEVVTIEDIVGHGGKWLTYKALLTQSGDSAPVARVLNEDEVDYLGEIAWSSELTGTLSGAFLDTLTAIIVGSPTIALTRTSANVVTLSAGTFTNMYVEIKVRQRGTAPVLLGAEIPYSGDRVILSFDKEMSDYDLANLLGDTDMIGYASSYGGGDPTAVVKGTDPKTLIIEYGEQVFYKGDLVAFDYDGGSYPIESLDRGLLVAIEDYPVTNNASAYTP